MVASRVPELHAVLLVGGRGERFWPLSTPEKPKQFLRIFSDKTMVEETVERISSLIQGKNIHYVLPPHLADLLRKTLKGIKKGNLIIEPEARNTAPAIALAARALRDKPEAIMAVLPADHLIKPEKTFLADLKAAAILAQEGYLVTFGIPPDRPETGYGYIEVNRNKPLGKRGFKVIRFREKPDRKTAARYVKSGNFLWNSGMFIWRVGSIIDAFSRHHPGIYEALLAPGSGTLTRKTYSKLEKISIDYAVMEKASNAAVVPASFSWDDVGSWTALERHLKSSLDNNVNIGKLIYRDSKGCIAVAEDGQIALFGVRDLVVVKTKDTVLVCAKERTAEIKKLLSRLDP
ncbi:NTP transferase domain-containing protein [candidate division WOR-3 bacterium]|uniref:mannose-1-phosphate guanylyltransferase n=1 Tax=candidate division WOR-3 bacterium TaxID=2052148 RepID=A0A9D5QDD7_UNCW3|nr:NTP transferase domain-containing protein [candidate division WOR-3 bacterium]MBD3365653.1 NTP transferase domain-containing protein [candidate division WOR-3 bacterium]